ncbi:TCP family transcription factor [Actinidia rufa]|uniref:TCP family transcription factor n=1 Tax=Actinidia rufa TaxID=165716 RepID=A0A7J0GY97_9ERIC|nr:TCP family transcription factor [Actinidia rufa]
MERVVKTVEVEPTTHVPPSSATATAQRCPGCEEEAARKGPTQQGRRQRAAHPHAHHLRRQGLPANPGARPQVRRPDHRVAPPPGRALHHRAATGTGTTPASFSTVSVSLRNNSSSHSSISAALDHKPMINPTPFILGKRFRPDDDTVDGAAKDDVSAAVVGPAGGFWALPTCATRLRPGVELRGGSAGDGGAESGHDVTASFYWKVHSAAAYGRGLGS